jgi:hypothetical protein
VEQQHIGTAMSYQGEARPLEALTADRGEIALLLDRSGLTPSGERNRPSSDLQIELVGHRRAPRRASSWSSPDHPHGV